MGLMYFTYNGQNIKDLGFALKDKPSYVVPPRDISFLNVIGRDGDIVIDNGRFENISTSYDIFSIPSRVVGNDCDLIHKLIYKLTPVDGKYQKLYDDYNPGYFTRAICTKVGKISNPYKNLISCSVTFDRIPYWYSDLGQKSIIFSPIAVNDIYEIFNPEFYNAYPTIRIYGSNSAKISMYINDVQYAVTSIDTYAEINCETGNTYNDAGNLNNHVNFDYAPYFKPGKNTIRISAMSNITKIEIIPRWRRL